VGKIKTGRVSETGTQLECEEVLAPVFVAQARDLYARLRLFVTQ